MRLPSPRGPSSSAVVTRLLTEPDETAAGAVPSGADLPVWHDEDLQLTLWICYELSYRGFDEVDAAWAHAPFVTACDGSWNGGAWPACASSCRRL